MGAVHTEVVGLPGEEPRRDGQKQAGAVAGSRVRGHRAPVRDPAQRADGGLDDVAARGALRVRDEADPARVPLSHPSWLHVLLL